MVVVVLLLAVAVAAALAMVLVLRRRLGVQRRLTREADERSTALAADAGAKATALDAEVAERTAAEARAAERDEQARLAIERAAAADAEARAAGDRAAAAEASAAELRATAAESAGDIDPAVLWILERARSERTWRFSVAAHPDSPSVFTDDAHPLLAAIQVELDAAREEVGAVVDLDAALPDGLTVGASVLALRATQELLADVVRRSEESTVRIAVEGDDLVVDIDAVDEHGTPVLPNPLPLPPAAGVTMTRRGVRIHRALSADSPDDA